MSKLKFKPLFDKVLILPTPRPDKVNGIYLPGSAKVDITSGTVVAVGQEVKYLKIGDVVQHNDFAGSPVTLDDVDYTILREVEVWGVH